MNGVTRRRLLAAAGGAAVGGLAGCTEGGGNAATPSSTPTHAPTATDRPAAIGATCSSSGGDYRFSPAIEGVEVGETVRWSGAARCKQQTVAYHPDNDAPLRIPAGAEPWKSPVLEQGEGFEHTFERPGVYNYFGLYEQFGQVGIVVVGEPDPADQPGLSEPGEAVPEDARETLATLLDDVETRLAG
jgi:plastocyanin